MARDVSELAGNHRTPNLAALRFVVQYCSIGECVLSAILELCMLDLYV